MMSPTRRFAAAAMFAAGAALPGSRALAQTLAPTVAPTVAGPLATPIEVVDEPDASVPTTGGPFQHMLAPVMINGQGPYNFLMDTGANTSCISARLAQQLDLTHTTPAMVHTVVGVRQRPRVMIDRLQVGSRNRRNVTAPALPISGLEVDGVLGVDWLKGQRLVMGFKDKSLKITGSRYERSREGAVVVPARRRLGQLTIVDADLNGENISAMVDSGSQVTICNAPLRALVRQQERKRGSPERLDRVELQSLAGEKFTGESLFLPFLRLGGLQLGNVPVVYADMHVFNIWGLKDQPAIVLGMDLLTQFDSVALDFGKSNVRFDLA